MALQNNQFFPLVMNAVDTIVNDNIQLRNRKIANDLQLQMFQRNVDERKRQEEVDGKRRQQQRLFQFLQSGANDRSVEPDSRSELFKTSLKMLQNPDFVLPEDLSPQFIKPQEKPAPTLYQINPADFPNQPQLKALASGPGVDETTFRQLVSREAELSRRKRSGSGSRGSSKSKDPKQKLKSFQMRELERMESQFTDNPAALEKIRRNKVRLGQGSGPFTPEAFAEFAKDPENYGQEHQSRITPERIQQGFLNEDKKRQQKKTPADSTKTQNSDPLNLR